MAGGSLGEQSGVATKIKLRVYAYIRSDYCEDFPKWLMITREPVQYVGTNHPASPNLWEFRVIFQFLT